jgi:hypothetical protein
LSGQTSTQRLHPLQAKGFTVIDRSPPLPSVSRSGTSKKGAVFARRKSASRAETVFSSSSRALRWSGSSSRRSTTR